MQATVVGGRGFIGRAVAGAFAARGYRVILPMRQPEPHEEHGLLVYAAGVSGDYRDRIADTYAAHVADLIPLLRAGNFTRFVYCSSTRVYDHSASSQEDAELCVRSAEAEDSLAISKIAGEALVLALAGERARIIRLSNILGSDPNSPTFVHAIVREAFMHREITLQSDPQSARDYLGLEDAAEMIVEIAERGRERIYNLASGEAVTNARIAELVAAATGARVRVASGAKPARRATISIDRLRAEFQVTPVAVPELIKAIVAAHEKAS